jgi:hypothetical protein
MVKLSEEGVGKGKECEDKWMGNPMVDDGESGSMPPW